MNLPAADTTVIRVGDDYDVLVGRGILRQAAALIPTEAERVMLVHPESLAQLADLLEAALTGDAMAVTRAAVPDAELAKTASVAIDLWSRLGLAGFTRSDAIIGLGGGTVTDLAGFVAATWLRGIAVVQVPTTVLGMVDAAVGGKTGINTSEGKNLVGAFHPPVGVLCDLDVLATLPREDACAGMAEIVKGGFIADPVILDLIEADLSAATDPTSAVLRELIERKIRVKAEVVAADLKESFHREILNYGHTFGHAVEQVEDFTMRHGEAISIGMNYAAHLAHGRGMIDDALLARHARVLGGLGLPTSYRGDRWDALYLAMTRDKKTRGSRLRFVVLDGLAHPVRLEGPSQAELRAAYAAVSA